MFCLLYKNKTKDEIRHGRKNVNRTKDGHRDDIKNDTRNRRKNIIYEKRNSQSAQARVSAAKKRKQRSDDLESIKEQLSSLSSLLSSKTEPEVRTEPEVEEKVGTDVKQQKRIRVTSKKDDEEDEELPSPQNESWMTSLTRFSAVSIFSLGAWYFQNRYGKTNQTQPPAKKRKVVQTLPSTTTTTTKNPMLHNKVHNRVGRSGFIA